MRVLLCTGLAFGTPARAEDGIPPEVLARLKAGTVFVKVRTDRGKATGSGFVVAAGGGSALVVTNRHVIAPKALGTVTNIQAVFHSGRPASELTLDAKVLAADADHDLAVLEVAGAKELPKPLDITSAAKPYETMPVYSFGFPFGEALSAKKGNPALTVGRATVSSLREDDRGAVTAIQLDGNLNPGNSGGPIVNGKGQVVGVAVAGVRGAGIGLAVPRAEVVRLLARQGAQLSVLPGVPKDGKVEVALSLMVLDPSQNVTGVRVRVVRTKDVPKGWDKGRTGGPALPGGEMVELKLDGFRAHGRVTLKAEKAETIAHLFQPVLVGSGGATPGEPVAADVCFDPNASGVAGQWTRVSDGMTELWSVRRTGGKWEVSGVYLEDGKEVGSFVGTDVEVTRQAATFVQKFVKPPPRLWLSGATITARIEGGKFLYTWRLNGSSGTRDMTPPRLVVRPGPAKDGKVEVALSLLVLDPVQQTTTIRVRVMRTADVPKGHTGALEGGEVVDLKVNAHRAVGTVTLKADKPETVPHLFQTVLVGPAGETSADLVAVAVCFDQNAPGVDGRWTGQVDGLTEVWTVRCVSGKWEVSGVYLDGEKEVGSFVGSDVKLSEKTLTFIHRFVKRPPRAWLNGSEHTAKVDGGELSYTWRIGGGSGTRRLTRLEK